MAQELAVQIMKLIAPEILKKPNLTFTAKELHRSLREDHALPVEFKEVNEAAVLLANLGYFTGYLGGHSFTFTKKALEYAKRDSPLAEL